MTWEAEAEINPFFSGLLSVVYHRNRKQTGTRETLACTSCNNYECVISSYYEWPVLRRYHSNMKQTKVTTGSGSGGGGGIKYV